MTTIIIISSLALIFSLILLAKISGSFIANKDKKRVTGSFMLFSIVLDFVQKSGQIKFWRLTFIRFALGRKKPFPVKIVEDTAVKKFKISNLNLDLLRKAKRLIGYIKINKLIVKIHGGFTEPFYTGKIYGYYWAMKGMFPKLMSHVDFRPDFSSGKLTFDSRGKLSIRLVYIIWILIQLGFESIAKRTKSIISIKERRTGYVH